MITIKNLFFISFCFAVSEMNAQQSFTLLSPDKKVESTITVDDKLTYNLKVDGREVMEPSALSMELGSGAVWGSNSRVSNVSRETVDELISSTFYRAEYIRDHYNSIQIRFKGKWGIEFRAYNEGIAYRFLNYSNHPFTIKDEVVRYEFPKHYMATVPYVNVSDTLSFKGQFSNSFENTYTSTSIAGLSRNRLMFLPLLVDAGQGLKLGITESDLNDYPGLYLFHSSEGLKGVFAPYPKTLKLAGHNNLELLVTEQEDYIAKVSSKRSFPWRIITIAREDKSLAENNLSYLLGAPSQLQDISWIQPGKVAWDWWNDWNLKGVDFRAGINTQTYKYYIDFASKHGIEYVILDEGWAVNMKADLMQIVPEIDLKEIVEYGKKKNVGIILWAGYYAFDRDMEQVCKHYAAMGVKGFKVDFMNRDDQQMTAFLHRAAEIAARYHLVLDFHGTHKPAGINRTWPNVLNVEGVFGLEQLKWLPRDRDQVVYDTQIPFIRQLSGPMDYTQGAMINATKSFYHPCNSQPMSQGTRCHQLALYMVLDSPINMLCDSPTNYEKEQESTEFIASIPTVWDETKVLSGEIGEYIVTARRQGEKWYIGGITNWTPRAIQVNLSFLGEGNYKAIVFRDGINADRHAEDYVKEEVAGRTAQPYTLHLAPGGGFAMEIELESKH